MALHFGRAIGEQRPMTNCTHTIDSAQKICYYNIRLLYLYYNIINIIML